MVSFVSDLQCIVQENRFTVFGHTLSKESWSCIAALGYDGILHFEIYDCKDNAITHKEFEYFLYNLISK